MLAPLDDRPALPMAIVIDFGCARQMPNEDMCLRRSVDPMRGTPPPRRNASPFPRLRARVTRLFPPPPFRLTVRSYHRDHAHTLQMRLCERYMAVVNVNVNELRLGFS
jgi:hypothetical protein